MVSQQQYSNLCVKETKENSGRYYPHISLEECVNKEKKTEKNSIKRKLVISGSNNNND